MATYARAKINGDFEVIESHTETPELANTKPEKVNVEAGIAAEIAAEIRGEVHFRIQENAYLLRAEAAAFREFFEVPEDAKSQEALKRRYEGE
jgi:hypothetical protein